MRGKCIVDCKRGLERARPDQRRHGGSGKLAGNIEDRRRYMSAATILQMDHIGGENGCLPADAR